MAVLLVRPQCRWWRRQIWERSEYTTSHRSRTAAAPGHGPLSYCVEQPLLHGQARAAPEPGRVEAGRRPGIESVTSARHGEARRQQPGIRALAPHSMPETGIVEPATAHLAQVVQDAPGAIRIVLSQPVLEQS